MLIDLTGIHFKPSNLAIEYLCKSVEAPQLFDVHPTSPLLAVVENLGTSFMSSALQALYDAAVTVLALGTATMHKAVAVVGADDEDEDRCKDLEKLIARSTPGILPFHLYLEIVDCLITRYLPVGPLVTKAKREAVRQYLVGHLRKRMPDRQKARPSDLPDSHHDASKHGIVLAPVDYARMKVAQEGAARYVSELTDSTRSRMQQIVIDAERRRINAGTKALHAQPLQQALADTFGDLNRDWRRIAITETAINAADGYLASMADGEHVQWLTHPGACLYCNSQNGKVFEVVASTATHKNPYTQVWVGKQAMNIGRSIAPRKRLESVDLVDRTEEELVVPAIPVHPCCRCLFSSYVELTKQHKARLSTARAA